MEPIVLDVELELILIFQVVNVYHVLKDSYLTLPDYNVFAQLINLIFRMENVYLVNIHEPGTQILTLAYLHVNKTNIGILILINVHGAPTVPQFGMAINVLNVLKGLSTLEIDIFV